MRLDCPPSPVPAGRCPALQSTTRASVLKSDQPKPDIAGVNRLYYGDNLEILRKKIRDETVDLCYIDPPFNSKRNYNQIYNNIGQEDHAQEQAFIDTWTWDEQAQEGYPEIIANEGGWYQRQTIDLIQGLRNVLGEGSLLAYLVSMTRRLAVIHRVLKPTGSLYLHCDPTSSHYLKLVLDSIFIPGGGTFLNEIAWCYASGGVSKKYFAKKHDIVLFYVKGKNYTFNTQYRAYSAGTLQRGLTACKKEMNEKYELRSQGAVMSDWWSDITPLLSPTSFERLGYPTQKPEALLERIISASSNPSDVILDAYCGCGTTVAVAQRLGRQWIGVDITYQSIALVLKRLEDRLGADVLKNVILDGAPKDMASAQALAHKKDDRVRKEFEKWALLTYTRNRAAINSKKGADAGIDGTAYFWKTKTETDKAVFQVKSGHVDRGDIAKLKGDMEREKAAIGTLITLEEPTQPMRLEAKRAGMYLDEFTGRKYDRIQIVTIREMLEENKRLDLPLSLEVLKSADAATAAYQPGLELGTSEPSAQSNEDAIKEDIALFDVQPKMAKASLTAKKKTRRKTS
jgi:DNA modification methylase